ncbi:MAG TPA: LacI family DNA-binding transcriptional regulator [Candidatus Eisenbacteria bacterium]|nr:LacI family DNA-binding transcriptional regulator [Candidatus Eisenbacteria bacterium]
MPTIRDVARASRVSVATVSRVFNDHSRVSETTRERVVAAANRLGYWPNGTARSLITNRTHALGVLLPDLHGEFFSEVIRGIDLAARQQRLHLMVSSFTASPEDLTSVLRAVRGRIDGLIVMTPDVDASEALRQGAGAIPTVLLNPEVQVVGCDSISIANFEGAHAMVRHLVSLGHRRIATVTGPPGNIDAHQRLEGYRGALRDSGIDTDPVLEAHGNFTESSGYEAATLLLKQRPRPTAVFVANDHMAVGVLGALQDASIKVPGDLAVAAFDDIPLARFLTPPLTTVHVDMLALGQRAVQLLTGPRPIQGPRREVLPTTLVIRASCGSAPPSKAASRTRWERRHAVPPPARGGFNT